MTDWIEIRVGVTPESEEAVANALCEMGSGGVVLNATGNGGIRTVSGYLPADTDMDEARHTLCTLWSALCDLGFAAGACRIVVRAVPLSEWTTDWQSRFQPIQVSDRITVQPPWAPMPADKDRVVVEITPGLAFGTGEHETTRLCLRAIDRFIQPDDRVLDVGTGSGILAIAAAQLGARTVVAVDVDEMAVDSARENVARNGVAHRVRVYQGGIGHAAVCGRFRLIISNIDTRTLIECLAPFARLLEPDGVWILSGVLNVEAETMVQHLFEHGFTLTAQTVMGEWWAGAARGRPH